MTSAAESPQNGVQVAIIKQMRLARAAERPNDAIMEITTATGVQRFLLPKAALKLFSEKLQAFEQAQPGKMD